MRKFISVLGLVLFATVAMAQGLPQGTQHSAIVVWTVPSPIGGSGTVSGYNIYRAPVSTGIYTKLNTTLVTALTLDDTTVTPGTQYNYCVTTVDSSSTESPCSTPAVATIPSSPNAPSVTVTVK